MSAACDLGFVHTKIWYREVGQVFPQESEMAPIIWALLVTRADLMVELPHIGAEDEVVERIDKTNLFARNYFLRGSLVTVKSGGVLLQMLRSKPEFQQLLLEQPEQGAQFDQHKKVVDDATPVVKTLRDRAAGHVEGSICESLRKVPVEELVKLEWTSKGFSSDIATHALLATMFPASTTKEEMDRQLTQVADASFALARAIHVALDLYDLKYPFLRR